MSPSTSEEVLAPHDARSVPDMGWAGKKNGELLSLLERKFEGFLTIEKCMVYQKNLAHLPFGVVVLSARSNRLVDLEPLVPTVLDAPKNLRPGLIVRVGGELDVAPDSRRLSRHGLRRDSRRPRVSVGVGAAYE